MSLYNGSSHFSFTDPTVPTPEALAEPICPARKGKEDWKSKKFFYKDRGFPNQSNEFDYILHNVDGGRVPCKRKHPLTPLDEINPAFHSIFDEKLHGEKLNKELEHTHLPKYVQKLV